jgi:hypothetical protein
MSALVILLEGESEPMPPPAPFNMERWPITTSTSNEYSEFAIDPDGISHKELDTRGLYSWRRKELQRHQIEEKILANAAKLADAKLETTYVNWAMAGSEASGRYRENTAGLYGGPDASDLYQAVVTLGSTGAVITFIKCAKDVLVAYIKRPLRKVTVKIGKHTFSAHSVPELDKLIELVERRAADKTNEMPRIEQPFSAPESSDALDRGKKPARRGARKTKSPTM